MIGNNLDQFANSPANLEPISSYNSKIANDFLWDIFTCIVNICVSKRTCNGKLKLKIMYLEEK